MNARTTSIKNVDLDEILQVLTENIGVDDEDALVDTRRGLSR